MKMKKIITVLVLTVALFCTTAVFASAEQVSSNEVGFSNIAFSNGYYGFCIDSALDGAYTGDTFTTAADTSVATNNSDGSDVSQQLKILFTQCFETIFVSDGNGGYVMDDLKADTSVQTAVWHFTDGRYIYGESKTLVTTVNEYTGPEIPDSGYTRTLENGDVISFYFTVVEPQNDGQQSFFAYKIETNQVTEHEHEFSDEWSSDETSHWHECACGEKTDVAEHEGNEADCVNKSVCEECGEVLSDTNPEKHTGNTEIRNDKPATEFEDGYTGDTYCSDCDELLEAGTVIPATHEHEFSDEWSSDETSHWHECACGEKTDVAEHEGNEADCVNKSVCEECGEVLSDTNTEKHTGNTEIRNDKPATEFEDGYTGDTYCSDCDELLEAGTVIPATHEHEFSDEWSSDETSHWHECACGEKTDVAEHEGNEADCVNKSVCEECGEILADENPDNHTGNTEIRNDKPATEFEDGYTGDTYCSDCDELLETGTVIPATHEHEFSDEWSSDETSHWHECACGEKTDVAEHEGNEADCVNKSVCEECGEVLSDTNPEKHTGNTEIRNDKPATEFEDGYTGDTYCSDCDELLEAGTVIPATHEHEFSDEWSSDETSHWHECACGEKTDVAEHTFVLGTCNTCGRFVGDIDFDFDVDINFDSIIGSILGGGSAGGSGDSGSGSGDSGSSSGNMGSSSGDMGNSSSSSGNGWNGSTNGSVNNAENGSGGAFNNSGSASATSPATGDETGLGFAFAALLACACVLAVIVGNKKKEFIGC